MSSSACEGVSMTTGRTAGSRSCFSSASTPRPDSRGRLTSSRISPGRGASAKGPVLRMKWRACSPSVTTCKGLRILWNSKASLVMRMSPSSSSTSSTSTSLKSSRSAIGPLARFVRRHGEPEPGALGDAGVEPDPAAEVLDDLPAHGQADSRSRARGPLVQSLEDQENAVSILRFDADSVVGDGKRPERAVGLGRDDDARRLLAPELERVAEQVLEDHGHQRELST